MAWNDLDVELERVERVETCCKEAEDARRRGEFAENRAQSEVLMRMFDRLPRPEDG